VRVGSHDATRGLSDSQRSKNNWSRKEDRKLRRKEIRNLKKKKKGGGGEHQEKNPACGRENASLEQSLAGSIRGLNADAQNMGKEVKKGKEGW